MKPDMQITQAQVDGYMEKGKENLGKVLSVLKADLLKMETHAGKVQLTRGRK